jgi:flagellar motility protein MotE (MotC chaperone)
MKKLFFVLILTLALNFLALGGAVGYLFQSGKLDKAKITKIREVVFPPPGSTSTTQPSAATPATSQPLNLANLLDKHSGSVIEQVDFIRRTVDAQMLELDRRQREMADLKRQVDLANQKLATDRVALEKREKALADREQAAQKLQSDTGFQNSLSLYNAMPAKQVKSIFMSLNEETVQQYLTAMDTRTAGKIIKEFKSPDETIFIQRVLERIRQAQVAATDGNKP